MCLEKYRDWFLSVIETWRKRLSKWYQKLSVASNESGENGTKTVPKWYQSLGCEQRIRWKLLRTFSRTAGKTRLFGNISDKLWNLVIHCGTNSTPKYIHCGTNSIPKYIHCGTNSTPKYIHCGTKSTPKYIHCGTNSTPKYIHCGTNSTPKSPQKNFRFWDY